MADRREPHEDHDPIVIARLLDRDIAADGRAAAGADRVLSRRARLSTPTCWRSPTATRAQPTPAPNRVDFTLTRR